jgi:hypothetical protein
MTIFGNQPVMRSGFPSSEPVATYQKRGGKKRVKKHEKLFFGCGGGDLRRPYFSFS